MRDAEFFVPTTTSREEAEQTYKVFQRLNHYHPLNPGRLFRVSFEDHGSTLVAEVGKEIAGWREPDGPVLAIIEGSNLLIICTPMRGVSSETPIFVGPEEVRERVYFDDYPALAC